MKRRYAALAAAIIIIITGAIPAGALNSKAYGCKRNQENKIALTFDDGPHPKYTIEILTILEEYEITATFFMVGENVQYYKDTATAVAEAGHEIGNHTYSHCHIPGMSMKKLEREITECENAIYSVCGYIPSLFRPPEGCYDKSVLNLATKMGYDVVLWSVDTMDWKSKNTESICTEVLNNVGSGDIILMHDYVNGSKTPDALRKIIPSMLEKGFVFVTVSQLIECESD